METLQIEKTNALKAYKEADKPTKKLLANLFGEKNLYEKITDRVNSIIDACEVLGIDPTSIRPYAKPYNNRQVAINAMEEMYVIAEALQEDWVADYSNKNQKKWYVWLIWDDSLSAFRFRVADYGCSIAHAGSGSRLSFPTKELAEHFGKIAISQYNKVLIK